MPTLLVVTGPPGAGKSTVARVLAEKSGRSVLIEGDAFFAFLRRSAIEPWLPEASEQNEVVTRAAASAAGRFVLGGYNAVYDGVIGPWFLPTFAEATGLTRLDYVVLLPSLDRCLTRVATRERHGFTDAAATKKMHREFVQASIDQRHVVVDPPDQVESVVETILIAAGSGQLTYRCTSR